MLHTILVLAHIAGAILALFAGVAALRLPNGTRAHRLAGKLYLLGWTALALAGALLGLERPGLSAFEVINTLGFAFVLYAYAQVLLRRRIGPRWLRAHYSWMLNSLGFLWVATTNQLLARLAVALELPYPFWFFILLCVSPALILPRIQRRLDARFAPKAAPQPVTAHQTA